LSPDWKDKIINLGLTNKRTLSHNVERLICRDPGHLLKSTFPTSTDDTQQSKLDSVNIGLSIDEETLRSQNAKFSSDNKLCIAQRSLDI